jgi:hypothetical protein
MTLAAAAYPSACRSGGDPADVELGDQLWVVEHVDRYRAVTDDCAPVTAEPTARPAGEEI